jgi:hypothetical protein
MTDNDQRGHRHTFTFRLLQSEQPFRDFVCALRADKGASEPLAVPLGRPSPSGLWVMSKAPRDLSGGLGYSAIEAKRDHVKETFRALSSVLDDSIDV